MSLDNTFATARNAGVYTGRSAQTFTFRGDLTRSDRIDIFKLTFKAGSSSSSNITRGNIKGGGLTYRIYGEAPGLSGIVPASSPIRVSAGTTRPVRDNTRISRTASDIVIYLKLFKPTSRKVNYNIRLTFRP
jgi:hypothetical protein